MNTFSSPAITGIILAGGRASRMGGADKGLLVLNDKPLIEYVIEILRPQVNELLINANRNHERYAQFNCPIIEDTFGYYDGPLAGMVSGLKVARNDYVLFVPCDTPFITSCLVERLYHTLVTQQADISVAHDGKAMQPVFMLCKRHLSTSLQAFLEAGHRKVGLWYAHHALAYTDFSDMPNAFLNINTPGDQIYASSLISSVPQII